MIEIKNVTKSFGDVTALKDVNITFKEGKVYGLLGRNGAGKSTLLNVISSRIFPNAGEVLVDGEKVIDNDNALGKMYLMSEKNYYGSDLKISEIFRWTKEFYGSFDIDKAMALSKEFGLDTKKKPTKLSTGYTSIFKNVIALSLDLPYVFLDEPVLGLDAHHRDLFYRKLIENYAENPRTYIISTHLIEEISKIIEDVIIIKEGAVVKNMSAEELLSEAYTVTGVQRDVDAYISGKEVLNTEALGGIKTAYVSGKPQNVPVSLEVGKADLQKLFIALTN